MSALSFLYRSLALTSVGLVCAGGALAQSWDLDNCVMTGSCTSSGTTVSVSGWYSNGSTSSFASGTLNTGGTAPGGWTGVRSKNGSAALEATNDGINHAIDNFNTSGASYGELVYLNFSKAVDLSAIAATWVYDDNGGSYGGTSGHGNFQLWRWNDGEAAVGSIGNYKASTMAGWTSVTVSSSDFGSGLSKSVTDGTYYSSHWLISTAFGQSNDAFKLGIVTAHGVCGSTNGQTGGATSAGLCDTTQNVPEPATMGMVLLAALSAAASSRRRKVA